MSDNACPLCKPVSRKTLGLLTYLGIAFAVTWAIELGPVRAIGYPAGNPGGAAQLWLVAVMFMPSLASLVARRVEGIGFADVGLRWGRGRMHLVAWLLPPAISLVAATLVLVLGQGQLNLSMASLIEKLAPEQRTFVAEQVARFGNLLPALVMLQSLVGGVIINAIPCLGEELGWRGYLQMRLERFGMAQAALLTGAIWGVWHVPIVAQGHNYPGQPVLGSLLFIVFCTVWGVILGWLRNASGSVLAAGLAHASINGPAAVTLLFVKSSHVLVGSFLGVIGIAVAAVFAAWLIFTGRLDRRLDAPTSDAPTAEGSQCQPDASTSADRSDQDGHDQ